MSWSIFLASAFFTGVGLWLLTRRRDGGFAGLRLEGVILLAVVVGIGLAGFCFHELGAHRPTLDASATLTPDIITNTPLVSNEFREGAALFILALAVYVLSGLRGIGQFPTWIADLIVVGCAFQATRTSSDVLIQVRHTTSGDAALLPLDRFGIDTLLTVVWIWVVSRCCASLNRIPAAAGGYLGVLGLTVALLLSFDARANSFFPFAAASSIGGAGLVAFVLAMRFPQLNFGWSPLLALGFLLGIGTAMGLLKNTVIAITLLGLLMLGLPLINVSIVRIRVRLRGYAVGWATGKMRLDQALAARGVPQRKIALYYFCVNAWLCLLALLSTRWFFGETPSALRALVYTIILLALAVSGFIVFFSLARIQMRRQPHEVVPDRVDAFGLKLSPVSMGEALDRIETFIASKRPHMVLTTDANAILTAKSDPDYADIQHRASLATPDGFGVIWGARLLNLPIYERVTGVDMVTGICERAMTKHYSIYILGSEPGEDGKPGVAEIAAKNLSERYPGMRVVGTHHGFWRRDGKAAGLTTEAADAQMADEICRSQPDVLFVAMGIPMQEKFIAAQLERMNVPVSMGVGGSFDVYSGKFNRAPLYVQRLGFEWLYRVWIDPSRWKRMGYVPRFMMLALKAWLSGPRGGNEAF